MNTASNGICSEIDKSMPKARAMIGDAEPRWGRIVAGEGATGGHTESDRGLRAP